MATTVALISGGLDSVLAARLVLDLGIEVLGLHFVSVFHGNEAGEKGSVQAECSARQLGIPLTVRSNSQDMLEQIKAPRHGYGKHVNPCIDCRVGMLGRAAEFMEEMGADFITDGEVVGQRPKSQHKPTILMIDKVTGLAGRILRPLSGKLLPATLPEERGWIRREDLLDLSGRGRKPQFALAGQWGLTEFATPAGGCLLTHAAYARRVRDLLVHVPDFDLNDAKLAKVGRHFRLCPEARCVVGRHQEDNAGIEELARPGDLLLTARDMPGALVLLRGDPEAPASDGRSAATVARGLALHYCKLKGKQAGFVASWDPSDPVSTRGETGADPICPEAMAEARLTE